MMRGKLLFLCQNLPYPPDQGARIRSYHILRLLSREYEVTALCFFRSANETSPQARSLALNALADMCEIEIFPIPQEYSRVRFVLDHFRSVVTGRAYTRWVYESETFRSRLEALVGEGGWDLVYVDSLDLVGYLSAVPEAPLVLGHHNVESQLLVRRAKTVSGLKGLYIALQAFLTRSEEERWCGRVGLNFVVSAEDRATLQKGAGGGEYLVVPNGVETAVFEPGPGGSEDGIVFVGGATWFPNRDGMEYFARRILPLIRQERPEAAVTWVGRASGRLRQDMQALSIEMTGYVDDIRPYVRRAACVIVPLRVGGGTRLKILDAWALGKAVVSTSQGCEGLEAVDGENILIRDSTDGFATAVLRLLEDHELRSSIGGAARETAVTKYDWEVIGRHMTTAVHRLVERPGQEIEEKRGT